MLHGWGQTQAMFRHQVDGLAPRPPRRHRRPARARPLRQAPPRLPDRPAGPRRPGAAGPPRDRPRRRAGLVDGRVGVVELHRPVRHRPDPPVRGRRPARRRRRRAVDVGAGAGRQRRDLRRVRSARPRRGAGRARVGEGHRASSCAACSPASRTPRCWAFVAQRSRHSRRTRACRCCATTARRTGATCCPASTCPRWSSAATAATSPPARSATSPSRSRCRAARVRERRGELALPVPGEPGGVQRGGREVPGLSTA